MWLRVMPQFDPERRWLGTGLRDLTAPGPPRPFGSEAFPRDDSGHVLSNDGFGIYVCRQPTLCVSYIFKTGEIWGIDAHHLGIDNTIPLLEPYFIEAFQGYSVFLREKLGVRPPDQWIAGIEGLGSGARRRARSSRRASSFCG